ncbi:MAG TPA: hypothetical protein VGP38_12300 [Rubrobacter sp.]|nr:hypothetical protein [Rubrobacter sp.]
MAVSLGLLACGGGAGTDTTAEGGAAQEIDVVAVEYDFEGIPDSLEAGPASFGLTNEGKELHELILVGINEGFTFEDAMKAKGEEGTTAGIGVIPPIEPGAEAEEALDLAGAAPGEGKPTPFEGNRIEADLEPGSYVLLCAVESKKEGKPHVELGQVKELTVQ